MPVSGGHCWLRLAAIFADRRGRRSLVAQKLRDSLLRLSGLVKLEGVLDPTPKYLTMRRSARMFVILVAGGLATLITVLNPSTAPAALLNLGPEQIVLAGGGDLTVPGYSVPCFTDFNSDGPNDLLVGEGGSGFDGKVRVYLRWCQRSRSGRSRWENLSLS